MFTHKHPEMADHQHETVAQAWACQEQFDYEIWQAKADLEAERRNEQWWENGGEHAAAIQSEFDEERRREQSDFGLQYLLSPAQPLSDCRGGVCRGINELCSLHQMQYQDKYGRASNE